MITTAYFEKYRKGDFYQFMVNVLEILTESKATTLQIAEQRNSLQTQVIAFEKAYKPIIGSELTPQLAILDSQRDDAIIGIGYLLEAYLKHYEEPKRQAAYLLQEVLKGYGNKIYLFRYQLETATITNLLNDWQNKNNIELQQLGLESWVTQLKEYNDAFNMLYVSRAKETAGSETGAIETLRNLCTEAYRTLKSHIEAHGLLNPSNENEIIQSELSSLVNQYNDAVTRYTSAEATPEEPTPENPDNNNR